MSDSSNQPSNQDGTNQSPQNQSQPPQNPLLKRPRNPRLSSIVKKGGDKPKQKPTQKPSEQK